MPTYEDDMKYNWNEFIQHSLSYYTWDSIWDGAYGWLDETAIGHIFKELGTIIFALMLLVLAYCIAIIPQTVKMLWRTPKRLKLCRKEEANENNGR